MAAECGQAQPDEKQQVKGIHSQLKKEVKAPFQDIEPGIHLDAHQLRGDEKGHKTVKDEDVHQARIGLG